MKIIFKERARSISLPLCNCDSCVGARSCLWLYIFHKRNFVNCALFIEHLDNKLDGFFEEILETVRPYTALIIGWMVNINPAVLTTNSMLFEYTISRSQIRQNVTVDFFCAKRILIGITILNAEESNYN